jgi:integrase
MAALKRPARGKLRGQKAITHSLDAVVQETFRLWRKHHLGYDQTKYVVERVRRRLALEPPRTRNRTVARLEQSEVERLIQITYRSQNKYGLMIKSLFQTGARVDEFVHIRVEDLLLDGEPPQIHIVHAKRKSDPIDTCRSCRRWRMNFVPIYRAVKQASCSRATVTHAIRLERSNRSSPTAPAPQASRSEFIRTCFVTR